MSIPFKDRLGPERESKCQSIFRAPSPSSLLAAASVMKKIMDAADAEKEQRLHREKEKRREDNSAVGGQEGEEEGERERLREADHRFHGEQEQLHHDAFRVHQKMALPAQEELTIHRVPPRRADRPFRKRERRFLCPERYHANHSGRPGLLRLATAGMGEAPDVTGRPSNDANDRNFPQMPKETRRNAQQHGPTVAGALAAVAAAVADSGDAIYSAPPSPSSMPSHHQRRHPLLDQPCDLARSTTRVISSETYLRRLFVTASLAHVLSLDACLPRSMPTRRAISSRAAGKEAGRDEEQEEQSFEEAGAELFKEQDGPETLVIDKDGEGTTKPNEVYIDGIHSNSTKNNKQTAANLIDATHESSGSFKIAFPVTLIDSAGRHWRMTYVTTTRDNLHSGRLVEGWETFCSANGLRIGDEVEFTRLEAHEQDGGQHGKEVVRVVVLAAVLKKHCRHR